MSKLAIVYRPLTSLIPYARNARTHSAEQVAQIAASIREFGWTNPVLVDGESGIIAGHGRVLAARQLGIDPVPCIELAGLSEAQRRAYILADNKLAVNAGWDESLLRVELADLRGMAFDLSLIGFGEAEQAAILNKTDGLTDPDDAPAAPEHPISESGDLWIDPWATSPPLRRQHGRDGRRARPRRRRAAPDGHRSAVWGQLRSEVA